MPIDPPQTYLPAGGARWKLLALVIAGTLAFSAIATFVVLLAQSSASERGAKRSQPHSELQAGRQAEEVSDEDGEIEFEIKRLPRGGFRATVHIFHGGR